MLISYFQKSKLIVFQQTHLFDLSEIQLFSTVVLMLLMSDSSDDDDSINDWWLVWSHSSV